MMFLGVSEGLGKLWGKSEKLNLRFKTHRLSQAEDGGVIFCSKKARKKSCQIGEESATKMVRSGTYYNY